ncbi:hypothetical protein EJB05_39280 [Eragrostis curvula]|uniref:At4g15545-like C-terminal domain-containing protein n=1 Tax=Eragrostis curvula TaxID=38414 RepID=A0A5J9TWH5_9POAL|nr:hypothetical protein EJB05_39280 [Eragrostis curvula]
MARQDASASGVDFHLPDEILAVIPTDPYEQLDVARKITSMAISSRVSRLEAEVASLRRDLADRDRSEADLRARLAETEARLLAALDENGKLAKERDSLAATAKKLARNLAKLEAFKKQLMKSLSEDNLLQLPETGQDHDTEDNLIARVPPWKDEVSSSHTSSEASSRSTMTESTHGGGRPRIDGKEFFRQARTRLSYEQFGAFLANIKDFNAQKQSREDTLSKAEEIFGTEHKDLYISFQNMLNRNQP